MAAANLTPGGDMGDIGGDLADIPGGPCNPDDACSVMLFTVP